MRFAYADPPYIGQAKKHYAHDERCAEVNHRLLIAHLCNDFDGWALSLSSPTLREILAMCPEGVRVGAWVKPFAVYKPGVNPAYAWEPVVFFGARKRGRDVPTVKDWVSANITLKKGLVGAKPPAFCRWLFELLGLTVDDTLHDIFPGTGIVGDCWEAYKQQIRNTPKQLELKVC